MSATHSDDERGTGQSGQSGPDSGGARFEKPQAHPRARAREDSPESAQSQPESPDTSGVTASDYLAEMGGWLRSTFTPPDIWSAERAALSKVWAYACRGEWTTDTGLARTIGQIYALTIAFPLIGVCALIEWVVERPARAIAVVVLLWLLSQVPPLAWLI